MESTLEDLPARLAVRLGLHMVSGIKATLAARIVRARAQKPLDSAEASGAHLQQHEMKLLAAAYALTTLSGHCRQQVWDAPGLHAPPELL